MITKIIKQIWNQRRMNSWIFIEVIIAGFFLWTVIDPMYVLTVNHLEPRGYEEDGRYVLQLGTYGQSHGKRDTTITKEQRKEAFIRIAKMVKEQPEVDSYYICLNRSFPNAGNWNGGQFYPDTASIAEKKYTQTQTYHFNADPESDMFRTLGMIDANTGEEMRRPKENGNLFVSELFAQKMFGTTQVVGQKIYTWNKSGITINGVFKSMKTRDFEATYPLIINIDWGWGYDDFIYTTMIVFRLKEGVDFDRFHERFQQEVAPHMSQANFYFKEIKSFRDTRVDMGTMTGIYSKLRLKGSLATFTLLCIFLGMVGTFWIRCNARRQEIGLMRSMGATERRVRNQFLIEAGILITAAFVFSLILVVNFVVMADGMAQQSVTGDIQFAHISQWLSPGVQFAMVSLITYLALLLIALVGTLIPVRRAVKVLPADALRDE